MFGLWFDGISGQIRSGDLVVGIATKPDVPGVAFDRILYDPSVDTGFKVWRGKQTPLSTKEKQACAVFVKAFLADVDYPVWAWDSGFVSLGRIGRKEAEANGHGYTTKEIPPYPAAKWTGTEWERIKAAIIDTGELRLDPAGVCGRCVLTFTAGEWAAHPQPDPAKPWLKWDFVRESWEDQRDFAQEVRTLRVDIISLYEHLKIVRFGRPVTEDEVRAWQSVPPAEASKYHYIAAGVLEEREHWLGCLSVISGLPELDAFRAAFELFRANEGV